MHPLFDNMKSLTYEDLEKKSLEIHKRMQMYARSGMQNPLIWEQLDQMREALLEEKRERANALNTSAVTTQNHVVVNPDPLEDDQPTKPVKSAPNTFNPIS